MKEFNKMGLLRILGYTIGGIGVGIGAVVALPIAGPIGAITGIGALIAGGSGAIAGSVAGFKDNSGIITKNDDLDKVEEQLKLEHAAKIEQLITNLKKHEDRFKEHKAFEEYTIAIFAFAFSFINCDNEMHPDEIRDIEDFISGELFVNLPISLKNEIEQFKNDPPGFNTAMEYVKKVPKDSWGIFDNIIDLAISSDDIIKDEELAYFEAWKRFKDA